MPNIGDKRQITLSIDQCRDAGIKPGDKYTSFVDNEGHIIIIKKVAGAAKGILKGAATNKQFCDEKSLESGIAP